MLKKIINVLLICQILISCGFTPALKVTENSQSDLKVYYEVINGSYVAKDTLRNYFKNSNKNEVDYISNVEVIETESAVNIDSNGSVLEYKIEILIKYEVINIKNQNSIHKSQSRGFANYDVSSSEYNNNLVKNEALKTAIIEAAQLMSIMIQSKISE